MFPQHDLMSGASEYSYPPPPGSEPAKATDISTAVDAQSSPNQSGNAVQMYPPTSEWGEMFGGFHLLPLSYLQSPAPAAVGNDHQGVALDLSPAELKMRSQFADPLTDRSGTQYEGQTALTQPQADYLPYDGSRYPHGNTTSPVTQQIQPIGLATDTCTAVDALIMLSQVPDPPTDRSGTQYDGQTALAQPQADYLPYDGPRYPGNTTSQVTQQIQPLGTFGPRRPPGTSRRILTSTLSKLADSCVHSKHVNPTTDLTSPSHQLTCVAWSAFLEVTTNRDMSQIFHLYFPNETLLEPYSEEMLKRAYGYCDYYDSSGQRPPEGMTDDDIGILSIIASVRSTGILLLSRYTIEVYQGVSDVLTTAYRDPEGKGGWGATTGPALRNSRSLKEAESNVDAGSDADASVAEIESQSIQGATKDGNGGV